MFVLYVCAWYCSLFVFYSLPEQLTDEEGATSKSLTIAGIHYYMKKSFTIEGNPLLSNYRKLELTPTGQPQLAVRGSIRVSREPYLNTCPALVEDAAGRSRSSQWELPKNVAKQYIYIYIYREREREIVCIYLSIYIYIYMYISRPFSTDCRD